MKKNNWVSQLCLSVLVTATPLSLFGQAAVTCPAYSPAGPNVALNPDFETVGPCGASTVWNMGNGACGTNSAASNWSIHSSNTGTAIATYQVQTTLPIGGLTKMLRIIARGNESGVWQPLPAGMTAVMVSAWIYTRRGHVVLQATGGNTGPSAWNAKTNEWEELRVCTNGIVPVDTIVIYNEDPAGGDFLVDRVEARAIN
jgi:hypothetical protein